MSKIFISYGRDESHGQNLATEAQHQLQSAGYKVFRDVIGLKPGDVWHSKLEYELDSSGLVILVVSEKIRTSDWVYSEFSMAREIGLPVIPVIAEKIRMPLWLRHLQVLDFSIETNWPHLTKVVAEHIGESAEIIKTVNYSATPKVLSIPLIKHEKVPVYQSDGLEASIFTKGARFIIRASANVSSKELQLRLLNVFKIGSTIYHLEELVSTVTLGVEVVELNAVPRQIPYSDNSVYFELLYESEKSRGHWKRITLSRKISLHVGAIIEELKLEIIVYTS